MKRLSLLCLMVLISFVTWAYDFSAVNKDGIEIFYNILDEKTIEVTAAWDLNPTDSYCGTVEIPATVDYNNTTYSVVGIGDGAFNWCKELIEVILPEDITYIGARAFMNAENLTTINFPSKLISIGDFAFEYASLSEATLPDGLTSIGEAAFLACQFETITVPNSVTYMGQEVFSVCEKLKTVTIGAGMTYVPDYTFNTCENLEEVHLPDIITSIGHHAFYICESLSTITLPDGLESIGDYAFYMCLRKNYGENISLTIPESVTYIGEHAFSTCSYLGELTILANISTIEISTFMGCVRLATVDIPKTVTLIETNAFYQCTALESFTSHNPEAPICNSNVFTMVPTSTCVLHVPKGTKEVYATAPSWSNFTHIEELDEEATPDIDENKFEVDGVYYYITDPVAMTCEVTYKTTSFNSYSGSVVIPETVTYKGNEYTVVGIGYSAFRVSTGLIEVTIPESVTYIDTYAFNECTALKSVSLPHGITEIGEYAFNNCTAITEGISIPSSVTYIGTNAFCGGTWKELVLEDGEQLLDLDAYAIQSCTIDTLYLGRDLTFSGELIKSLYSAFKCTKKISNVIFSERLTSLCDYEFYGCSGFKEMVIPGHITTFGESIFYSCLDLESVTISPGITTLGENMFAHCTALTEVSLPDGIVELPGAFWDCTALTEVSLPEGIVEISGAFRGSGLEEVTVPSSVTSAKSAFRDCLSLKKVVFSEGFSDISQYMFENCSILEDVTFPTSLTMIRQDAFYKCTSLKEVILPEGVTSVARSFYGCSGLTYILLPQSITSLSQLEYCSSLKKIVVPKQVKSLGSSFFAGCSSLEEIILLENMQTFSYSMFNNCPNLRKIYSLVSTPPTKSSGAAHSNILDGVDTDNCVLCVPVGAKETYANDENWYVFTHIEELDEPLAITYGTTVLSTDSVEITGYIAVGSVGIAEVGFEYWSDESDVKTITAIVEDMKADLTDLPYATTYTYRAYAKTTTGNTIYGDNLTFTTTDASDDQEPNYELVFYPEDGSTLDILSTISISCEDGITRVLMPDEEITIVDSEGNYYGYSVVEVADDDTGFVTEVDIILTTEIVDAGTYYVNVPAGYFDIGNQMNNAFSLTYYITGTMMGINDISLDSENVEGIYSTSGQKLNTTVKGVNIIRYKDGTTKKVLIK